MEASTDGMVVAISASERIPEMERRFLAAHSGAELLWTPYVAVSYTHLSEQAGYLTGAAVPVDGGRSDGFQ